MRQQYDCSADAKTYTNRDIILLLDITPCDELATYVPICTQVKSRNDASSEETETLDMCEGKTDTVTSVTAAVDVEMYRTYKDPACKFIVDRAMSTGIGRQTNAVVIFPDGIIWNGPCTITGITTFGGDMSKPMDMTFSLIFKTGEMFEYIVPGVEVILGAFPVGVFDFTNLANATLTFSFPNVTEEDIAAQPRADIFGQKAFLFGNTAGTVLPYTLDVDNSTPTATYTLTFDATGNTAVAFDNIGIVANNFKTYTASSQSQTV